MCRNQRSHSKFLALASAKQVFSTLQGWPSNYGICLIYDMMCVCVCCLCFQRGNSANFSTKKLMSLFRHDIMIKACHNDFFGNEFVLSLLAHCQRVRFQHGCVRFQHGTRAAVQTEACGLLDDLKQDQAASISHQGKSTT